MGLATHNYHAGETVSVITVATTSCPSAVVTGLVTQVRITEQTTSTIVKYDVRIGDDAGTTEILASNMYGTLEEAIAAYYDNLGGTVDPVLGSPSTLTLSW